MAEKHPMHSFLTQLFEELYALRSSSIAKFEECLKTKFLPNLGQMMNVLGEQALQALVRFLGTVIKNEPAVETLEELFATVYPLVPVVLSRAGVEQYEKTLAFLEDVVQELCQKGASEVFLENMVSVLSALQELWCREPPFVITLPPSHTSITIATHVDVLTLASATFRIIPPAYQRLPSSPLHTSLATTSVFFGRTAFSNPLVKPILQTLHDVTPKLPVPLYHPAATTPIVCSFALQISCCDGLERISETHFISRGGVVGAPATTSVDGAGMHGITDIHDAAGRIVELCLRHDPEAIKNCVKGDDVSLLISGLTKWESRTDAVQSALKGYLEVLGCETPGVAKICSALWDSRCLPKDVQEMVLELAAGSIRAVLSQNSVLSGDLLSSTETKKRRKFHGEENMFTTQSFFGPCGSTSPLLASIIASTSSADAVTLSRIVSILMKVSDQFPNPPSGFLTFCADFLEQTSRLNFSSIPPKNTEDILLVLRTLLHEAANIHIDTPTREGIATLLHNTASSLLTKAHEPTVPYVLSALRDLPPERAEDRLQMVLNVMQRGVAVADCCETVVNIMKGAMLSESTRCKVAKVVYEGLKGAKKDVFLQHLAQLLSSVYSMHHTIVLDDDDGGFQRQRSGSAKRRRQSVDIVTGTLEYDPWKPSIDSEPDRANVMDILRVFVEHHVASDALLQTIKDCLFGGPNGIGFLGSAAPKERIAARRLACSIVTIAQDILPSILPSSALTPPSAKGPKPTPLEALVTVLATPLSAEQNPEIVHSLALLLGTISRVVELGDPALGLVIAELVLQMRHTRTGAALTVAICRQELNCLETKFGTPLAELFKRYPMVFKPLLDELPAYNVDRDYSSAPLLSVVADYLDQDIPTFVVENIPGMLSWVIRTPGEGDCVARAHHLCECIRELNEKSLQQYGLNFKSSLDKTVLLAELLLVYLQPILVSILLDTEGSSWSEYFKAVKRQLTFIHDTGRGQYVQALKIKEQAIVKEIVGSTGKAPDFGKGVARAGRALQMLHIAVTFVKDTIDGKGKCPIPSSPSVQNDAARSAGAKEKIKQSFFSILDGIGELFSTGYSASGHFTDIQSITLGLRTLKGVILLLGTATEQFTSKITSSLNLCNLMLPVEEKTGGKEIATLLTETWVVYVDQLSQEVVLENLDSFVIAAVGMTRVTERAVDLLMQLYKKTNSSKEEWDSVRHFLPTNNEVFQPILKAIGIPGETEGFMGLLKGILQGLTSLSRECRRVSLLALIDLLKAHRKEMLGMCEADEPPEIIVKLVDCLLTMARDWDNDAGIHNCAMSCLGLIGAIEPNKMSRIQSTTDGKLEDLDDETFAVRLINEYLLKTLQLPSSQAGRSPAHDKAAYCIQELLKSLRERSQRRQPHRPSEEHTSSLVEVQKYPWWQKINEEGKKKIAAYLDTKYKIVIQQQRDAKEIEYQEGMPFRAWLKAWMVNLISKTKGPRGIVMQNVRNVVKDDFDMALFILPYLVLNTCMHGGHEVIEQISREICTVLSHADVSPKDASEHAQVLCSLLDKLANWKNTVEGCVQLRKVASATSTVSAEDEGKARNVAELLNKVPYALLARACRVTNPARSLRYTEQHLRSVRSANDSKPTMTQLSQAGTRSWCDPNDLQLYQEVYSRLGERDGLLGVRHLRQQNAFEEELQEEAVDLETMGRWSDAMQRYELLMQQNPAEIVYQERMLECLQALGQYSTMVATTKHRPELRQYTAQAAWRLGDWDLVKESLNAVGTDGGKKEGLGSNNFEKGLAMGLLALKNGDCKGVMDIAYRTREGLHTELAAACLESYHTAYKYLVKLHALTDIERAADASLSANRQDLISQIKSHTQLTEQTPETREILLTVRHALCNIFKMDSEGAGTWLELAKLCRTAGLYQMAEGAVLRADRLVENGKKKPHGLVLEHAKLLHAKGDTHNAVRLLVNTNADKGRARDNVDSAYAAKIRLKAVDWASEINHLPANEVQAEYREISREAPSEAVFLSLAKFMEKMLMGSRESLTSKKDTTSSSIKRGGKYEELMHNIETTVPHIFKAYADSLNQGTKHLYHALPRLISLYISEITLVGQMAQDAKNEGYTSKLAQCGNTAKTLSAAMTVAMKEINGATLYTSLNTLVPLLTHSNQNAVRIAGEYVRKILKLFPERAVWSLMVFQFSSRPERVEVLSKEVIQPMKGSAEYTKTLSLFSQAKIATTAINKLAAHQVPTGTKKVNFHEMDFYRPLKKSFPLSVVVPIQSQLNLTLPNHVVSDTEAASLFSPDEGIQSTLAEVAVMNSLQHPKKVTVLTTTGMTRSFLCKARDELRKDHRVMELCHIMNLLLKKNPETRRRQLYTRTFAVTMTGDASGMIEWVENVRPFRSILDDLYTRAGKGMKPETIRTLQKQREAGKMTQLQMLMKILKATPPMMHRWFAQAFVEPTTWFRARNTYTKSAAVWSMMGHIVGLGDRHAENILVDTGTGDMVHVDFAVLFDKGMSLAVPEVVRFRLTQNVVDGFGICGVEGMFRRCAELTMSVMRTNKDIVMSIMDQFIHDPCMEKTDGSELPNIARRLDGYYDEPSDLIRGSRKKRPTGGVQLGVQGQVQKLIANTTSCDNLSVIYIWWMPWY